MQVKKQQLELDMEQQTGSKYEKAGPGAMKTGAKGEFVLLYITWPKAKECGLDPGTFCLPSTLT